MRKSNRNSENRMETRKTKWELRKPNGSSEDRTGTPKTEWELRKPNGSSQSRIGTPKSICEKEFLARNRHSRRSGSGDSSETTWPSASPNHSKLNSCVET